MVKVMVMVIKERVFFHKCKGIVDFLVYTGQISFITGWFCMTHILRNSCFIEQQKQQQLHD